MCVQDLKFKVQVVWKWYVVMVLSDEEWCYQVVVELVQLEYFVNVDCLMVLQYGDVGFDMIVWVQYDKGFLYFNVIIDVLVQDVEFQICGGDMVY